MFLFKSNPILIVFQSVEYFYSCVEIFCIFLKKMDDKFKHNVCVEAFKPHSCAELDYPLTLHFVSVFQ